MFCIWKYAIFISQEQSRQVVNINMYTILKAFPSNLQPPNKPRVYSGRTDNSIIDSKAQIQPPIHTHRPSNQKKKKNTRIIKRLHGD